MSTYCVISGTWVIDQKEKCIYHNKSFPLIIGDYKDFKDAEKVLNVRFNTFLKKYENYTTFYNDPIDEVFMVNDSVKCISDKHGYIIEYDGKLLMPNNWPFLGSEEFHIIEEWLMIKTN